MTKVIGLTGGIGSGKTTVARYFQSLGVPVYIADEVGKKVLAIPENIIKIKQLFGESVFTDMNLDRKKIADIVFNDPEKLSQLNSIVHPAVREDFNIWLIAHDSFPFIIKEAAILFESGSYKECNLVITVSAPVDLRVQRVVQRDKISEKKVLERMKNQWSDDDRERMSDFIIVNIEISDMRRQVRKILKKLKNI